jgi:hypothetical protein
MSAYATDVEKRSWSHASPCTKLNRLIWVSMQCLGDTHEERAEKVLGSHSQERSGNPADGQIRTQYNIPAESEAQSTHEVQHGGPSRNFIRFGRGGHTK